MKFSLSQIQGEPEVRKGASLSASLRALAERAAIQGTDTTKYVPPVRLNLGCRVGLRPSRNEQHLNRVIASAAWQSRSGEQASHVRRQLQADAGLPRHSLTLIPRNDTCSFRFVADQWANWMLTMNA